MDESGAYFHSRFISVCAGDNYLLVFYFIYNCIIDSLNERMNTTIQQAFNDDHIFEVFVLEFLLACVKNGDYVDPRDVQTNLKPCKAREFVLQEMEKAGIR